ncbi:sugar ABC transporter permease [Paenibacillus sp. R14(2021)]|uniref:ABC transporter permease n=1 Tax=Paenibacillus sp. R14(2021) TaxID=2859228 RepID=UPI0021578DE6|nr:ABC transporter permease subunit [Paenibacillus sp. R14(2021)]
MRERSNIKHYWMMLIPGLFLLFVFNTYPLFGSIIAFQNYNPFKGMLHSKWVGLENFEFMFRLPDSRQILWNTVYIACLKIIAGIVFSLTFAILLNELRLRFFKRSIQTLVYIPHFLSWVILSGILIDLFSLEGMANKVVQWFGFQPIQFLGSNRLFPFLLVGSDVWKEFGFGAIVYLAALAGINPGLYEAAAIDGANRFQRIRYITLPGIVPTIVLLVTLSLGNILNAGFDQIFNMYNPVVYESSDIIDTYVYRAGLVSQQYSLATAVGLMKSLISFFLIVISNMLAKKFANYRIF